MWGKVHSTDTAGVLTPRSILHVCIDAHHVAEPNKQVMEGICMQSGASGPTVLLFVARVWCVAGVHSHI